MDFCLPINPPQNGRVKLVRFDKHRHAKAYFQGSSAYPELYSHMTQGPYKTEAEFVQQFIEGMSEFSAEMITFAIIHKTKPATTEDDEGPVAGMVSYNFTNLTDLSIELGFVIGLPAFQKTYVATNAAGLLLQLALQPKEQGGLGMRRVVWQASVANPVSLHLAERLGFQREGVLRWSRYCRAGKQNFKVGNGKPLPPGLDDDDVWRDMVVMSLCWDDWERGGQSRVKNALNSKDDANT